MEIRRIKASTLNNDQVNLPARIVLCELKNNACKYATWLECFPSYMSSYFVYGGYFQTEKEALHSFNERMPIYKVERDLSFIPDTDFFEI